MNNLLPRQKRKSCIANYLEGVFKKRVRFFRERVGHPSFRIFVGSGNCYCTKFEWIPRFLI